MHCAQLCPAQKQLLCPPPAVWGTWGPQPMPCCAHSGSGVTAGTVLLWCCSPHLGLVLICQWGWDAVEVL